MSQIPIPRMFPVQNRLYHDETSTKPGPPQIPWEVAEKVYAAYSAQYGTDQSLERLGQRGGFGLAEMDMLYPQWREDIDALAQLRKEVERLKSENERLVESSRKLFESHCLNSMHKITQSCPVCVEYVLALAQHEKEE